MIPTLDLILSVVTCRGRSFELQSESSNKIFLHPRTLHGLPRSIGKCWREDYGVSHVAVARYVEKQLTGRGGLVLLQGSCLWPCLCQPCTPAPWWSSSRSSWFSCTTIVLQDCSPFRAKEADMSYLQRRLYSNQLGGVSPSSFSTFITLSRQAWVVTIDISLPQGNC